MDFFNNIDENLNKGINNIKNIISNIGEMQNKFLESNIGQAINSGINIGIKAMLPNFIEDEVIAVKEAIITKGFKAGIDTAINEAISLGKTIQGIFTGKFDNVSQIKEATEKGGLIDSVSEILGSTIDLAKKEGLISKDTATALKKGKNAIMNTVENEIDNELSEQVASIEKLDKYIDKWKKYYEEQNFNNMEYQYKKIEENIENILPLEETIKKARVIENLHQLIKNNGKNFQLTQEEKELAEILTQ